MCALKTYNESGYNFTFEEECLYRIEDDELYKKMIEKHSVKAVDFLYGDIQRDKFLLFEVKSTIPRGGEELELYKTKIVQKFRDSLLVTLSIYLERNSIDSSCYAERLKEARWFANDIVLILVVPEAPTKFLPQLQDLFSKEVGPLLTSFSITGFSVINAEIANKKGIPVVKAN